MCALSRLRRRPPVSPVSNAARNVLVCRRPQGAWSWTQRCPAVPPKQIGGDAGFVQTHEVGRSACNPRGRDVRPIVFGRVDRFF